MLKLKGLLLLLPGDLAGVGQCMSEYWQLKKKMAPGCEPELVTCIMQAVEPHVLGMSMAGAGGGGFMYLLTRTPDSVDLVRNILTKVKVPYTVDTAAVRKILRSSDTEVGHQDLRQDREFDSQPVHCRVA